MNETPAFQAHERGISISAGEGEGHGAGVGEVQPPTFLRQKNCETILSDFVSVCPLLTSNEDNLELDKAHFENC